MSCKRNIKNEMHEFKLIGKCSYEVANVYSKKDKKNLGRIVIARQEVESEEFLNEIGGLAFCEINEKYNRRKLEKEARNKFFIYDHMKGPGYFEISCDRTFDDEDCILLQIEHEGHSIPWMKEICDACVDEDGCSEMELTPDIVREYVTIK